MPKHVTVENAVQALSGIITQNSASKHDVARIEERFDGIEISPVTYFYPDYYTTPSQWAKVNDAVPAVQWVIANPNSGPQAERNPDYAYQIDLATGAGLKVMAYISTRYAGKPVEEVKTEVVTYLEQYPKLSGIFLDEGVNGWGDQAGQEAYYQEIYDWFKADYPSLIVAVNPGSLTTPSMVPAADILMTFEHDAASYLTMEGLNPDYYRKAPRNKFWHVVYGVTSEEIARQVIEKAKTLHVGHLYLTDKPLDPNPYGGLPAEWLWKLQIEEFAPITKASIEVTQADVDTLQAQLEAVKHELEVVKAEQAEGLVVTSEGGVSYRISVDDEGAIHTTAL